MTTTTTTTTLGFGNYEYLGLGDLNENENENGNGNGLVNHAGNKVTKAASAGTGTYSTIQKIINYKSNSRASQHVLSLHNTTTKTKHKTQNKTQKQKHIINKNKQTQPQK